MTDSTHRETSKLDLVSHIANFRFDQLKTSDSYMAMIILLVAAIFFTHDLYIDILVEGKGWSHVVVEGGIFFAVLLALGIEVKRVFDLHMTITVSRNEIQRLKCHLAEVISGEFDRWRLTKTEKEVALLLVKGLSMLEIAELRGVKEKSVRQQATGIYSKAGVSSRYELTAHFIEDLLAPDTAV